MPCEVIVAQPTLIKGVAIGMLTGRQGTFNRSGRLIGIVKENGYELA
jgi:hypothetical protein